MPRAGALILLYHRVTEPDADPQRLAVRPAHFAAHLEAIRAAADVLSLAELVTALDTGRLPARGIVVTFDDGYADNATTAAPLLTAAHVPATFFLTSRYVDGTREFWWDELEQILLGPAVLPPALRLSLDGAAWVADLGTAAAWTPATVAAHRGWTVEDRDPTPRHAAYRALCTALKPMTGAARTRVLDQLAAQTRLTPVVRPTHRPMRASEALALARTPGLSVGAHSASHPSLAALPVSDQRAELLESRNTLAHLTQAPIAHMAYPFGGRGDQSWRTRRAARAAGYTAACANEPGLVRSRATRFRLPRVLVRDWDAATFTGQLERWFDA